jgi:predicted ATP-binding protein involved in virulence
MYLVELEIQNVRAIKHMALNFRSHQRSDRSTRRWTVLLGENGCGKSTILKSIGLLLAGSEALPDLIGEPDQWIHNSADIALLRAVISTVDGQERTVSLAIHRNDRRDSVIKRNARGLRLLDAAIGKSSRNYFVAGYGAFRRPPDVARGNTHYSYRGRAAQLGTMFALQQDLVSLEQWVMDLDYVDEGRGRDFIGKALGKLLPGMTFKGIDKKKRAVIMSTVDGDVPLSQLSEGYQAMAAWAGDLLFRMTESFSDRVDPLTARGVLLIDEMDLHLHPIWKRNLVEFLDSAFPNLQVISTTHSPLSIQQCGEGELYVVRREQGTPVLVPFQGDPSKLRLSELFLSPLIGLETLDSPKVAALRELARNIELQTGAKSQEDVKRLRSIQHQLEGTNSLAPEEAPAFAQLLEFQKSFEALDVGARVHEAQSLFGTARIAVPFAESSDMDFSSRKATMKNPAKKKVAASKTAKKIAVTKNAPSSKTAERRSSTRATQVSEKPKSTRSSPVQKATVRKK